MGVTSRQTGSSNRPSIAGGCDVRAAIAVGPAGDREASNASATRGRSRRGPSAASVGTTSRPVTSAGATVSSGAAVRASDTGGTGAGCTPDPGARSGEGASSVASAETIWSCAAKRSLSEPSTLALCTTSPDRTSTMRAVIRRRSPTRWYVPPTSKVAPSWRPMSSARVSSTRFRSTASRAPSAPITAVCATSVSPTLANSAETVWAMPSPIQSSAGCRLRLANGMTATHAGSGDVATGAARVCAWARETGNMTKTQFNHRTMRRREAPRREPSITSMRSRAGMTNRELASMAGLKACATRAWTERDLKARLRYVPGATTRRRESVTRVRRTGSTRATARRACRCCHRPDPSARQASP